MKVVIPGGTGQVGGVLGRALRARGHEVVAFGRGGAWTRDIDGSDVVINLAGRSVNCRYTAANLKEMMDSRVSSTRAVGLAIGQARRPPAVWLQMSTATIYAHRHDAPNDEETGRIGGDEPDVPAYWKISVDIARAWERAQQEASTPGTRKVALRTAMVMSPDRGGIFDVLLGLTRWRLGGPIAGGRQFVSWIHDRDFARAVELLIERDDLEGPVNLAGGEVEGGARCLLSQDRYRADLEEPARGAGAPPRRRLLLRVSSLVAGSPRPGRTLASGRLAGVTVTLRRRRRATRRWWWRRRSSCCRRRPSWHRLRRRRRAGRDRSPSI